MKATGALDALQDILKKWPQSVSEPEMDIRSRLQGSISETLRLASLRQIPDGEWRISAEPVTRLNAAKFLVTESKGSLPTMAELHYINNKWVLTAFDIQCPVCFGNGINGGRICDLCFGVGWGCYAE